MVDENIIANHCGKRRRRRRRGGGNSFAPSYKILPGYPVCDVLYLYQIVNLKILAKLSTVFQTC